MQHTRQLPIHTYNNLLYQQTSSGAAGAWGRGAPVSKPSSSSTNGERPKLNLSKKTEPKDKENNSTAPPTTQTKVEETKKPVEKRGWEVKPSKSTESATTEKSKKDTEEKKEENNEPTSTAAKPAVRSFAAMAAKPAAPPPVVDKPVQSEPEKKKKEDSPTKKKEDNKKDDTTTESSNNNKDGGEKKHRRDRRGERSKPREPMVMNSRAAMLGDAEAPKKEVSWISLLIFIELHYMICIFFF